MISNKISIDGCTLKGTGYGGLINIYNSSLNQSHNIFISNSILRGESVADIKPYGIAVMSVENLFVDNVIFSGLGNVININYYNNALYFNNCIAKNNKVGINVVSNTYKNLFIINSVFENETESIGIVPSQTFYSILSKGKNNNFEILGDIQTSRFKLKSPINSANSVNGELFESENDHLLFYKNSEGTSYQLTERHFASPSSPATEPLYVGERFLDTRYSVFYEAINELDTEGNNTYRLIWSETVVMSDISPIVRPMRVGQLYFNRSTKDLYIGIGIKDSNDWYLLTNLNRTSGDFEYKPLNPKVGFAYFCSNRKTVEGSTNGIMIYHKGNNVWVDALGRVVE